MRIFYVFLVAFVVFCCERLVNSEKIRENVAAVRELQALDKCQPFAADNQTTCESLGCPNLKWVSASCPGRKGRRSKRVQGCLQARWCGYSCQSACKSDKLCAWNRRSKRCRPVPDPFNLTLTYPGPVQLDPEQRAVVEKAAQSWARKIRHGLPTNVTVRAGERYCGYTLTQDYIIQDLLVLVFMQPIDGLLGIYAQAGVCGLDNANYARLAIIRLDEDDFPTLVRTGQALGVVQHELGHTFGIGSLWDRFKFITENLTPNVRYLKPHGKRGNQIIQGPNGGPFVEDEFGPTTSRTHWKEFVYGNELMTGVFNAKQVKMSAMTLGALKDLGYDVDMSLADKFIISQQRSSNKKDKMNSKATTDEDGDERLLTMGDDSLGEDHEIRLILEEDEK